MTRLSANPFATLIEPHLPALYRFAWRLTGNGPDAEDLVQDACEKAWQKLALLEAADYPERWLMRILYNRFVDGVRHRERSPLVSVDDKGGIGQHASTDSGPAEIAEQDEREQAIDHACMQLSESHRALLSLRAEGHGLAEIEQITGISRDVLRARLHRARLSLARHLDEQTDEPGMQAQAGSHQ